MKKLFIFLTILLLTDITFAEVRPERKIEIFFEGTDYELHVYRIKGRFDGNTMLIIGGIQGDEPGGFLSADLYSDLALEKGNLIVVPRANLKSVILFNRGADGDMNRLFAQKKSKNEAGEVVEILKHLINESDILLNLHDGWGFHRPEYIDKNRNPDRFGQSLIIDGEIFICKDNSVIKLGEMGRKVLEKVNAKIADTNLNIHLFDTKTADKDSKYQNMRKTATWYALTEACVPAFGLEGSKNVKSIEQNVLHHNFMINEFMKLMDIVPEQPQIIINKPVLHGVTIKINDETKIIKSGMTVNIKKGDTFEVVDIDANHIRGITCDILGYGSLNDINKPIKINDNTKIIFRKDSEKIGEVTVTVSDKPDKTSGDWLFLVKVDGKDVVVPNGETLHIKNGSTLQVIKLFSASIDDVGVPLNIKGWYPEGLSNNGDDRGYIINFPESRFMNKYAVDIAGKIYPIVVWDEKHLPATMYIKID